MAGVAAVDVGGVIAEEASVGRAKRFWPESRGKDGNVTGTRRERDGKRERGTRDVASIGLG